jgi:hypothetical protein
MFDVAGDADELVDFGFALDAGAIIRCASTVGDPRLQRERYRNQS